MKKTMNLKADRYQMDVLLLKRKQHLLLDILLKYTRWDVAMVAAWLQVDVGMVQQVLAGEVWFDAELAGRLLEVFLVGVGG